MKPTTIAGLLLATLFLTFCRSDGQKDLRNYYFPLKALEDGLVYEYAPVGNDSLSPVYWYYRSFIGPDGVFMTGTYYEYDLVPLQMVREELVQNGMMTQSVYLYERAPDGGQQQRTDTKVVQSTAFPFEVSDSGGVFLYEIRWEPPQDSGAVISLAKNRRYLGDTTIVHNGERYPAVVLEVKELLEYDKNGVFEQSFRGREVYAKGLGLVYYDKQVADGLELAYELHRRYPMTELEAQFKNQ